MKCPIVIVRGHNASYTNLEQYSTIWNILNLLGAHELTSHAVMDFLNDTYGTHYLAYGYQMKHPTWKHTTSKYKEDTRDSFHTLYNDSRNDKGVKKIHSWLERHGLFEPYYYGRERDSIYYENRIAPSLGDTSIIKSWREEIIKRSK